MLSAHEIAGYSRRRRITAVHRPCLTVIHHPIIRWLTGQDTALTEQPLIIVMAECRQPAYITIVRKSIVPIVFFENRDYVADYQLSDEDLRNPPVYSTKAGIEGYEMQEQMNH